MLTDRALQSDGVPAPRPQTNPALAKILVGVPQNHSVFFATRVPGDPACRTFNGERLDTASAGIDRGGSAVAGATQSAVVAIAATAMKDGIAV